MPAEPFKFDGVLDEWKRSQILRFCKATALDVGCNTGELVGHLNAIGIRAEGIDTNQEFIRAASQKFPLARFHAGQDLSVFQDSQFETVIAWNVLEHIPDDRQTLKEFLRIANVNVILSIPKEDEISLPSSRVTYRPYVDPTHVHYYTREILTTMLQGLGTVDIYFEDTTRVRPLLAYEKIGIPAWLCRSLDTLFWSLGRNNEVLHANLMAIITKQ
jgi:ubiquinone/menaquinone biosynthesis C-methylase UbiE